MTALKHSRYRPLSASVTSDSAVKIGPKSSTQPLVPELQLHNNPLDVANLFLDLVQIMLNLLVLL